MEVPAGTVQDGTLAKEHAAETGPEISNGDTMAQA